MECGKCAITYTPLTKEAAPVTIENRTEQQIQYFGWSKGQILGCSLTRAIR
jgi:hypothetical protein